MDFAPVVYEHAAFLIRRTPWEVSRDPLLLASAHAEAYRIYGHSPVVTGIDVYTVEAEAYGAVMEVPEGSGIPSIRTHPVSSTKEILQLHYPDPAHDGRMPMMVAAALQLAKQLPGTDVRVPICGPFSLLSNLVGFDTLLCDVLTDPDDVREALLHCAEGQKLYIKAVTDAGLGVTIFDSGATPPLLSPRHFRELLLPALTDMVHVASGTGRAPASCILGGDSAPIIEDVLSTGAGYVICPSETDGERFLALTQSHPEVRVRVNMDPAVFTREGLPGILMEVERVAALARRRANTCIGTGVVPFDADPGLVLRARDHALSL